MKNVKNRILCGILSVGLIFSNCLLASTKALAMSKNDINIVADWTFDLNSIESGSIEEKNLIFKDNSGNGNSLKMNTYGEVDDYSNYMSFSNDRMYEATQGSLIISGDSKNKIGADLITVNNAPINKEKFENGYTIEFIYKLPINWTVADSWMSLMARQGDSNSMDEPELGTMNVAISNCKEIQFLAANKDDNHEMSSAAWSLSMDKGGVWYHIAIVNDNKSIRTFVNGAEAFRDYISDDMIGLYADPEDGRFRIGSSMWKENGISILDKFAKGNYQQVRIADGALSKSDWLIPNPEAYIGEYGNNNKFSLVNDTNYNMVFMPDTQNTIKFRSNVMNTAMDWLINNKDSANIISVTHLGDVVENGDSIEQWDTAKLFSKLPSSGLNLLMQPGNHDLPLYYDKYFGTNSDYGKLTSNYVVRNSPSGRSSYMINDGGSYKYMTLSIDYHSFDKDLNWIEEVLSTTNMPTIITSHDLQNCSDTAPSDIKLSQKGEQVWNIVKKYNQVFMMIGGHSHGAGNQILINDSGNEVFSILADYQFAHNGGNALFKFAEFDESNNKIYLSTFSPYAATLNENEKTFFDVNYLTGDGNYNVLNLNFSERFNGMDKSDKANAVNKAKAKLRDMIDKLSNINLEKYTPESVSLFTKALSTAKEVLNSNTLNESEVLSAIESLNIAFNSLKEKPNVSDEESEKEDPSIEENENSNDNTSSDKNDNNNSSLNKLPQTGGVGTFNYSVFGIILATIGTFYFKKSK